MRTFVIAEAGSTWRFDDWHLGNAYMAIDIAKKCGADAVKFQYCSNTHLMEQRRNVPMGSYDILAWPEKWIKYIADYCEEHDIEFMCTVFMPCDVEKLDPYVKRWKVASLESEDRNFVDMLLKTGKPIVVSWGGSSDSEDRYANNGISNLHCTASYPASLDSLNLKAIHDNRYDGYSDHSCDVLTGALAVACGASIVEVHFKQKCTPCNNPDFRHSLATGQLKQYIANIRQAERMLGDGIKKVEKCEEWALKHKVRS